MIGKLCGFVATTKPAEALAFYRDVLGLRLVEETQYAIVMDDRGTTVRVQKAPPGFAPARHTVLGWRVDDMDAAQAELSARGVTFERYPFMPEGARYWATPDGAKVAWFLDPDGNVLSLDQQPTG
jgi:catechol 2,3-dioxygenase-like lactoylglutathione lyase family enzyme